MAEAAQPTPDKMADRFAIWAKMCREAEHVEFSTTHTAYGTTVLSAVLGNSDEPAGFTAWWSAYPACHRKRGRGKCLKKWRREGVERFTRHILNRLESDKVSREWSDGYIPAPHKWLCDEPWDGWEASVKPEKTRPSPADALDELEL